MDEALDEGLNPILCPSSRLGCSLSLEPSKLYLNSSRLCSVGLGSKEAQKDQIPGRPRGETLISFLAGGLV